MKKLILILSLLIAVSGCSAQQQTGSGSDYQKLDVAGSMELDYAKQFCVDYLSDGCSLITITDSGRFLLVPKQQEPPRNLDEDITVLRQPIENIYLAATSAMCLFDALDVLDSISMSGTQADGWYIENARRAMESGTIVYAGKYSAPDYELIMARNCGLTVESTMINHTPEVMDKLADINVPVLVERSSYERHPLGRTEWIKLYGLLTDKAERAEELFREQAAYLEKIPTENTGKTVAFFYISSSGSVVSRKSGDYAAKMIELAGGKYAFTSLGSDDSATGSVNLSMENFYAEAKDADYIIYNSSIDGDVDSIGDLLKKSHLIAEFKAVQNNNVWCTGKNLFQETTEFGLIISDMHRIFSGDADGVDELNYLYRLR